MRKICYITGTRADFGLMSGTLELIKAHPQLDLFIIATSMHLSADHGMTIKDITASGFTVDAVVPLVLEPYTGATMASNIGHMLIGFVQALQEIKPDVVLLLGDRGEMLAGALAAIHLNIHIAHIHGGELSGTVDEPVRHCISKLSHFHFTSTINSKERLVRMGELESQIWVTGAPGLDAIYQLQTLDRAFLAQQVGLDPNRPIALFIYHPVLQESEGVAQQTQYIIQYMQANGIQLVALMPNSDAGSLAIRTVLDGSRELAGVVVLNHLERVSFLSWMDQADFMLGNSSAGIIEAASFGTPVINIGIRQNLRERNVNVMDICNLESELHQAVQNALAKQRYPKVNIYGDGGAAQHICRLLSECSLDKNLLLKTNAY